jgi:glycosyltransferase involved in cell wall biosynthesis
MDQYKIAIEAQLIDDTNGGVATHLAALVKALGELDGPETYKIVCAEENPDWLASYIGPNQEIVMGPRRQSRMIVRKIFGKDWIKIWGGGYRKIANIINKFTNENKQILGRVDLRGYYDRLGVKLVHVFPQIYILANQPIIFNPHDLQHEHFPEFFSAEELSRRKYSYLNACREAKVVVAGSQYTKNDVIKQYGISPDNIIVIPLAPATEAYQLIEVGKEPEVLKRYGVPTPFILYPAVTWPHKNHLRLLKAISQLRSEGMIVNLVCTGKKVDPSWNELESYIYEQGLSSQVKFLGFISGSELRYLYRTCLFIVAPSLFEEHSGPMWETWHEGTAIACSNITSLPEQAGNAALIFDPYSVESIAGAIRIMWENETLRMDLKNLGGIRLRDFSWEKTSKAYRALYRLIAGYPMTNEDFNMLEIDWMSGMKNQQVSRQINHKLDG